MTSGLRARNTARLTDLGGPAAILPGPPSLITVRSYIDSQLSGGGQARSTNVLVVTVCAAKSSVSSMSFASSCVMPNHLLSSVCSGSCDQGLLGQLRHPGGEMARGVPWSQPMADEIRVGIGQVGIRVAKLEDRPRMQIEA